MRWPLQPLQPLQKTQLQPPFGPSVDSLCHPWFTTTNISYRFPIFETSATASCGTTGLSFLNISYYHTIIIFCFYKMLCCIIIQLSYFRINYRPPEIKHDRKILQFVRWCSHSNVHLVQGFLIGSRLIRVWKHPIYSWQIIHTCRFNEKIIYK